MTTSGARIRGVVHGEMALEGAVPGCGYSGCEACITRYGGVGTTKTRSRLPPPSLEVARLASAKTRVC